MQNSRNRPSNIVSLKTARIARIKRKRAQRQAADSGGLAAEIAAAPGGVEHSWVICQ